MNDASGFTGFENTGVDATMEPRDRIFLSNHIRDFEIGAYPDEFGVTQRVRFDVMLDVRRFEITDDDEVASIVSCLLYTSPSPRDRQKSRMPSSA